MTKEDSTARLFARYAAQLAEIAPIYLGNTDGFEDPQDACDEAWERDWDAARTLAMSCNWERVR